MADSDQPEYLDSVSLADTCAENFHLPETDETDAVCGCLLQIYPASSGSELIHLSGERTVIGRDRSCDITLEDTAMSRTHAAVDLIGRRYFLTDLNSTNGTYLDDQLLTRAVPLKGGEQIRMGGCILKFMSALDEEANYLAAVHELMTRDSLTNTFNRSYVLPLIEKELQDCLHLQQEVSVVLLDIDHFKKINDRHGHLAGDEVLRIFSERTRRQLHTADILARFGGEEFLVVCPRTSADAAERTAERIRLSVSSKPFSTQAGDVSVTCSLGVAASDGRRFSGCDELLSAADACLYQAKNNGRNQVCTHTSDL